MLKQGEKKDAWLVWISILGTSLLKAALINDNNSMGRKNRQVGSRAEK